MFAYVGAVVISTLCGIPTGVQHRTVRGASIRGMVAGTIWATALVTAHTILGASPLVTLPEPELVLVPISAVVTAAICATSCVTARRRHTTRKVSTSVKDEA